MKTLEGWNESKQDFYTYTHDAVFPVALDDELYDYMRGAVPPIDSTNQDNIQTVSQLWKIDSTSFMQVGEAYDSDRRGLRFHTIAHTDNGNYYIGVHPRLDVNVI